ncbi:Uncharacterised protein [uncultured Blautia sp.]|nr:Uncharacterised protein [uncultured Blautia sp.]
MSQAAERWDLSYTQNRELSWLAFDQRVLEEGRRGTAGPAAGPGIPGADGGPDGTWGGGYPLQGAEKR